MGVSYLWAANKESRDMGKICMTIGKILTSLGFIWKMKELSQEDYSGVFFLLLSWEREIERMERAIIYFPLGSCISSKWLCWEESWGQKMTEIASGETLRYFVFYAQTVLLWDACDKMQYWAQRLSPLLRKPSTLASWDQWFWALWRQQSSVNISIFLMFPSTKSTISLCLSLYK